MADYEIRPLQLRILEILLTTDRVCKQHHLRYYIIAGTMLGAIRHQGFIPWDDDIDIGMPRKDYDLLIANAKQWLPEAYELICAENDKTYPLPFAKIQDKNTTLIERIGLKYLGGVYIDVFPLDGVPSSRIKQKIHFTQYFIYKKLLYYSFRDPYKHGKGISSWIPLLCRKILKTESIQRTIRKILTKYDFDESKYIADFDDGAKGIMPKQTLGVPTSVIFENNEVMGIENYDAYLSRKYGEYMTIPSKDKQRQHNFYYLDLTKSYNNNQSV